MNQLKPLCLLCTVIQDLLWNALCIRNCTFKQQCKCTCVLYLSYMGKIKWDFGITLSTRWVWKNSLKSHTHARKLKTPVYTTLTEMSVYKTCNAHMRIKHEVCSCQSVCHEIFLCFFEGPGMFARIPIFRQRVPGPRGLLPVMQPVDIYLPCCSQHYISQGVREMVDQVQRNRVCLGVLHAPVYLKLPIV